jgi:multidrug efflux pump subunit AcrA (membrane-fusion protein)
VISYISVNVNEDTRTVPIRARLANADGKLKTNMYAEIDLEGASRKFLACPKSAHSRA